MCWRVVVVVVVVSLFLSQTYHIQEERGRTRTPGHASWREEEEETPVEEGSRRELRHVENENTVKGGGVRWGTDAVGDGVGVGGRGAAEELEGGEVDEHDEGPVQRRQHPQQPHNSVRDPVHLRQRVEDF